MSPAVSPWLNGFVETLGYYWTSIWGELPSSTGDGPFAEFAVAAYAALDGDADDLTTQKIRTIVARVRGGGGHQARRDEDQFDRYERIMAEQRAHRKAVGEERWQEETAADQAEFRTRMAARPSAQQAFLKDIFDGAKSGPEQARAWLDATYAGGSADDRAFLENLGYEPLPPAALFKKS
jgi:membrane protein involved in colicin uptake